MENFGKFCATTFILIFSSVIGGFVFMKMWEWFITTPLNGPKLSLANSIGLMFFIHYLQPTKKIEDKTPFMEKLMKGFIYAILLALVTLSMGWAVYQFI